jgi:Domain of unknown function (DUF4412)
MSSASGMNGSMKVYHQDGNTRSEMDMAMPQMPGGGMKQASLMLKSDPNKVYMLNLQAKTYTEMETGKSEMKEGNADDYEVTLIGKEKVNGYSATHVKLKRKGSTTEEDLWVSTDVPNFANYKNIRSKYTNSGLYKALGSKGADGFLVRIKTGEHGRDMQMDLVKAENKTVEASLFSLTGFTKSAASPYGNGQEMMEKMKNMTPEERQKFIEEMRKAHGAGQ